MLRKKIALRVFPDAWRYFFASVPRGTTACNTHQTDPAIRRSGPVFIHNFNTKWAVKPCRCLFGSCLQNDPKVCVMRIDGQNAMNLDINFSYLKLLIQYKHLPAKNKTPRMIGLKHPICGTHPASLKTKCCAKPTGSGYLSPSPFRGILKPLVASLISTNIQSIPVNSSAA